MIQQFLYIRTGETFLMCGGVYLWSCADAKVSSCSFYMMTHRSYCMHKEMVCIETDSISRQASPTALVVFIK